MQDLFFNQNSDGIDDTAEFYDYFGWVLGDGDFDGDGRSDLTIGIPEEGFQFNGTDQESAGVVSVLYGSSSGPSVTNDDYWHQGPLIGEPEGDFYASGDIIDTGDDFGYSLGSGDFDGDGFDDLAAGVPGESIVFQGNTSIRAGAVNVLYGSNTGLTAAGNQIWHQNSQQNGTHIRGGSEERDEFGTSLAAGDFDNDGFDDLAAGVPGESIVFNGNESERAGAVNVLYGSNTGLTAAGNQIWHQNSQQNGIQIEGGSEEGDEFGSSLAVGDFDGDGRDDLAIGVPQEALGSIINAGAVNVLYGSNNGLSANGNQIWHQNSDGVKGTAEAGEYFGNSVTVGDFDNDGFDDLAIGTSYDRVDGIRAGSVNILYGSANGLRASGDQLIHQNSPGVKGVIQSGDHFGSSLGSADYNGDGFDDLAIGVPGEDVLNNSIVNAGAVHIIFGSNSGLVA